MALAAACSSSSPQGAPADAGPEVATDAGSDVAADTPMATCDKAPAAGFSQVVPGSMDGNVDVGAHTAMTLDKQGNPVIAYGVHDATTTKPTETIYVVRWDPCLGAWTAPMKIDNGFGLEESAPTRAIAIATDDSDGRIGIVYAKDYFIAMPNSTHAAFVSISTDGGKTFSPGTKVSLHGVESGEDLGDIEQIDNPTIALAGGKTFVAYNQQYTGCGPMHMGCRAAIVLATGGAAGAPFVQELMKDGVDPEHGGFALAAGFPIGLAVDSANVPALLAHVAPASGYNTKLMFFRPGAVGTVVTDSAEHQNDSGSASLVFDGTKPRGLTRLDDGTNPNGNLRFLSSTDGKTWLAPKPLPLDGSVDTPDTQMLLTDGKGGVVVLSQSSDDPGGAAAGPKFWRSTDLATFVIGGAGPVDRPVKGRYMSGRLTSSGKIRMAFYGDVLLGSEKGVVYWSEP